MRWLWAISYQGPKNTHNVSMTVRKMRNVTDSNNYIIDLSNRGYILDMTAQMRVPRFIFIF